MRKTKGGSHGRDNNLITIIIVSYKTLDGKQISFIGLM